MNNFYKSIQLNSKNMKTLFYSLVILLILMASSVNAQTVKSTEGQKTESKEDKTSSLASKPTDGKTLPTAKSSEYFTEQFTGENLDIFDLGCRSLTFSPDGSGSYTYSTSSITNLPTTDYGTSISLGNDDSQPCALEDGKSIWLYGVEYTECFIGSNGYITFNIGETTSKSTLEKHFKKPRISMLFNDLSPNNGGEVYYNQLSDRLVITFVNVPEYGSYELNTFQSELYFDGKIVLSYLNICSLNSFIVGLSDGNGLPSDFLETDFVVTDVASGVLEFSAGNTDSHSHEAVGITVQFTTPNSSSLILSISRIDAIPSIVNALPSGIQGLYSRYWAVEASETLDGKYDITLDLTGLSGMSCSSLYMLKREVTLMEGTPFPLEWIKVEDLGGTIDQSNCPTSITISGLDAFSEFVVARAEDSELPVELTSFRGSSTSDGVRLQWQTASEQDNAGFILYRNGLEIASYENTNALVGQGTTSSATNYAMTDEEVTVGETYTYKIQSVDLSGTQHDCETPVTVTVQAIENTESQPTTYALKQNYPNPFNPTTNIEFSLKQAGKVTFQVFDILGRVVYKSVLQGKAGENTPIQFSGDGLNSGVYFYQVSANGFSSTKKMMLLK
ncbi:hypothetical protein Ctha_0845 [Chloroherpeton thalassium ATCC 35110]|uniref:Secretion system C-terminal sorting domain-containing protein n=2 Tax=Chloroherpeton thalassium TaxID=100716 RepID=B3QWU9_CHLT3|nr:hypothetical protein Ctha_0845 [Chloroherpeton thalassium ATCC 35110]